MTDTLPQLTKIICDCIDTAENEVRRGIAEGVGLLDEEEITSAFRWTLSGVLRKASDNDEISRAIQKDIEALAFNRLAAPLAAKRAIRMFCMGVHAAVAWHPRQTERRTGADFALVVARPSVKKGYGTKKSISAVPKHTRGILVQAKKKKLDGKWRQLTKKQKQVLPGKEKFLSLLLYDLGEDDRLAPFSWCPCGSSTTRNIVKWLKNGEFPNPITSSECVKRIAAGTLGTDDKKVINGILLAEGTRVLIIEVDWPDDDDEFKSRVGTLNSSIAVQKIKETPIQVGRVLHG